jgi:sulfur-oxidizing protein SoxY
MDHSRREVLKTGGGLSLFTLLVAAGWLKPESALAQSAWNKAAFEAKAIPEALKALGAGGAASSTEIAIQSPDIAENGAVVPVTIASKLAKTEQIAILIEKNPNMLAASFEIMPMSEPTVTTRVKMGQTSNVYALVKADGKYYTAVKEVKVTLGGCGG